MEAVIISILALLVSVFNLIFNFCKFKRYDEKIKKFTLNQIMEKENSIKKADFSCEIRSKSPYEIIIKNEGQAIARNVRLGDNNIHENNGFICNNLNAIFSQNQIMEPGSFIHFYIHCEEGHQKGYLTILWDDDFKDNNFKKIFLLT